MAHTLEALLNEYGLEDIEAEDPPLTNEEIVERFEAVGLTAQDRARLDYALGGPQGEPRDLADEAACRADFLYDQERDRRMFERG